MPLDKQNILSNNLAEPTGMKNVKQVLNKRNPNVIMQ